MIWCGGSPVTFSPLSCDRAGGRGQPAADQVEQGGFSGAVRPDDGVAFAGRHGQADAANDLGRAEILVQVDELDRRRGHFAFPAPCACDERIMPGGAHDRPGQAEQQEPAGDKYRRRCPWRRTRGVEREVEDGDRRSLGCLDAEMIGHLDDEDEAGEQHERRRERDQIGESQPQHRSVGAGLPQRLRASSAGRRCRLARTSPCR